MESLMCRDHIQFCSHSQAPRIRAWLLGGAILQAITAVDPSPLSLRLRCLGRSGPAAWHTPREPEAPAMELGNP